MWTADFLGAATLRYASYVKAATPSAPQMRPMTILDWAALFRKSICSSGTNVNPQGPRPLLLRYGHVGASADRPPRALSHRESESGADGMRTLLTVSRRRSVHNFQAPTEAEGPPSLHKSLTSTGSIGPGAAG